MQKQQEDAIVLSTLEASEVSSPPAGEDGPILNGRAESTTDSFEREPDLETADEVTENGPTGGEYQTSSQTCVLIVRLSLNPIFVFHRFSPCNSSPFYVDPTTDQRL